MSTKQYRERAHTEMRELWEVCDTLLRAEGVLEKVPYGEKELMRYETLGGAIIERMGDCLEITCDFEQDTNDGHVEETVTITFAPDIRDLADSKVSVEWHNSDTQHMGTNTIGVREYANYARLMSSVVPEFVQT